MFRRILLTLAWVILCPVIAQAQGATVVIWGNYVWIDSVPISMDDYNFLYGGGTGGPHAENEAVAIENPDTSGDGGMSHWDPWKYVKTDGGWKRIDGKIDLGSTWADNTITRGDLTVTVSITCKMSYTLTSAVGINFSVIGLTVGTETLNEYSFTRECVGEVPYGVRKTFTAEALKLGLSVQFSRIEWTLGWRTDFQEEWACIEKPDESNVGFRTS